jgi:hypothetical protein
MDTYNQSEKKINKLEDFLDALEKEETADDVTGSEIEAGEAAYQAYVARRDIGKSLEELKAELG